MQNNIGSTDTVNARLTPGEFVIKKSAVDTIGLPLLRKLNNLPEEGGHDNIDELIAMANMVGAQAMPMGGEVTPNYQGGGITGYQDGNLVGPPAPPQLQQGPPQLRQMPPQEPQQPQTYRDSMGVWNQAFMKNQQSKQNNLKNLAVDTLNEIDLKRMVDSLMLEAEGAGRIRRLDESPRHLYNDLGQRPPGSI